MKKTNKENPIIFFRKADEARQKVVNASMKKMAKGGPEGAPEETPKPTATAEKTEEQKVAEAKSAAVAKAKQLGSMTGKEYRQEKRGYKRAAKIERIANGTQAERTNNIIGAIGNVANAAATTMETIGKGKETFGRQKKGGAITTKKMARGGIAKAQYGRSTKMTTGGSLKPVPTDKTKSLGKLPTAVRNKMGFQKQGGATKTTKFAALAPPYNKATAADRIAGAKKNARKK